MKFLRFVYWLRAIWVFAFAIILSCNANAQTEPVVKIHYLGHSSFILQFDNGVTVVTDYGKENAWVSYGWDSPINSMNDLVPNIMTYSHTHHEDHYDPARIPGGVEHILTNSDTLLIKGLSIKPIRVCEKDLNIEDNSAFLFAYKGFNILHLGDAQVQIQNIADDEVKQHIKNIIPESLDLLFMPIDGPTSIDAAAVEEFLDAVQPKRVIPMHYWTKQCKENFFTHCQNSNKAGKSYTIEIIENSDCSIFFTARVEPVKVISLVSSAYHCEEKE